MGCGIGPQTSLRDSRPFGVQPSVETLGSSRLSLIRDTKATASVAYGPVKSLRVLAIDDSVHEHVVPIRDEDEFSGRVEEPSGAAGNRGIEQPGKGAGRGPESEEAAILSL